MDIAKLERATKLNEKILELEGDLDVLNRITKQGYSPRPSIFNYNQDQCVGIPTSIFHTIGNLIKDEVSKELNNLRTEFNNL